MARRLSTVSLSFAVLLGMMLAVQGSSSHQLVLAATQAATQNTVTKLVFMALSPKPGAMTGIAVADTDGSHLSLIHVQYAGVGAYPSLSPDGRSILYGAEFRQLFLVSTMGGLSRQINSDPVGAAAWSPDGKSIIYSSQKADSWDLYTMNVDTNEEQQVKLSGGPWTIMHNYPPALSPNGKLLMFTAQINNQPALIVADRDGKHAFQFLKGKVPYAAAGVWSPDGKHIAFNSTANANNSSDDYKEISVVDSTGNNLRRLTDSKRGLRARSPRWSPDGTQIVFMGGEVEEGWSVYMMGIDGSNVRRIYPKAGIGDAYEPSFGLIPPDVADGLTALATLQP